jgi:hypothetical protein
VQPNDRLVEVIKSVGIQRLVIIHVNYNTALDCLKLLYVPLEKTSPIIQLVLSILCLFNHRGIFSLAVSFAAKLLYFISSPLYLILLLFHIRAKMFHFLRMFLTGCSVFHTPNTFQKQALTFALMHSRYFKYNVVLLYSTIQHLIYFNFTLNVIDIFFVYLIIKTIFTFSFHIIFILPSNTFLTI